MKVSCIVVNKVPKVEKQWITHHYVLIKSFSLWINSQFDRAQKGEFSGAVTLVNVVTYHHIQS